MLLTAIRDYQVSQRAVIIGTTGIPSDQLLRWRSTAESNELRLLIAPNTSLGVLALTQSAILLTKLLSNKGFDIEVLETHHRMKKDAPSGTAKYLANAIVDANPALRLTTNRQGARQQGEVGLVSMRGGGVFGEHEIRMLGTNEEVTISHRAFDRTLFAKGALMLAMWLRGVSPGVYSLADVDLSAI